jgi:hypothetical protein
MNMKTLRGTLFMPLLFGGLVLALAFLGRLIIDRGHPITDNDSYGMLVWILVPALG